MSFSSPSIGESGSPVESAFINNLVSYDKASSSSSSASSARGLKAEVSAAALGLGLGWGVIKGNRFNPG